MLKRVLFALFCLSSYSYGGMVYNLVPSSSTSNVNGLEFQDGKDLILTNTLVDPFGNTSYLNFGVGYKGTNEGGDVLYTPRNDLYQLYVLDNLLSDSPKAYLRGLSTADSEAKFLGSGRYEYTGLFAISDDPNNFGNLNNTGILDFTFNTSLPLGRQIESGQLTLSSSVPEPSSLILIVMGIGICGMGFRYYV